MHNPIQQLKIGEEKVGELITLNSSSSLTISIDQLIT